MRGPSVALLGLRGGVLRVDATLSCHRNQATRLGSTDMALGQRKFRGSHMHGHAHGDELACSGPAAPCSLSPLLCLQGVTSHSTPQVIRLQAQLRPRP